VYIFRLIKLWLFFAAVIGAAYLANQNLEPVTINLRPALEVPVVVPGYQAYLGFFLIGVSSAVIYLGGTYYRKVFTVARLNRRLRGVEADLERMANPEIGLAESGKPKRFSLRARFLPTRD
jgi:hypothetical protein